jgi:hypothetical protein
MRTANARDVSGGRRESFCSDLSNLRLSTLEFSSTTEMSGNAFLTFPLSRVLCLLAPIKIDRGLPHRSRAGREGREKGIGQVVSRNSRNRHER